MPGILHYLEIQELVQNSFQTPLVDVRSPGEFEKGHIPGAINIPLFTNEQRSQIGTAYKRKGHDEAVLLGLGQIGPELKILAEQFLIRCPGKRVTVHCWRGGLRSASVGQLLSMLGFEVQIIKGGYKQYRKWAISQFSQPRKIKILGGYTGSSKTELLYQLNAEGRQVVDLEGLACHLGSVFGTLGKYHQPSQEQFENELARSLFKAQPSQTTWIEDESRTLGKLAIPLGLWDQMRIAPVIRLEIPRFRRKMTIEADYQSMEATFVALCIQKISKRLGGLQTRLALEAIERGDRGEVIELLLDYYDRTYTGGQQSRAPETITSLPFSEEPLSVIIHSLIASDESIEG